MSQQALYPLTFEPLLKEIIWGGQDIRPFKGLEPNEQKIGESWEISHVDDNFSVVAEGSLKGQNLDELIKNYGERLVGRGPLAGPVVAAAVILPKNCKITGLNDSKKIPKKKHLEIFQAVQDQALSIGIGIMDNQVIDQVNIYEATKLAMQEAISQLSPQPEHLLIDAMKLDLPISQTSIIKGDANSLSIAAASIVAKVTRDELMNDYDQQFPGYDFASNAGYGTAKHLEGLEKLGVTPIHRTSFEPVKSLVSGEKES